MMHNEPKVKNCPFCGGAAVRVLFVEFKIKKSKPCFGVVCETCKAEGAKFCCYLKFPHSNKWHDNYEKSKIECVEAWNKRA